MSNRFAAYRVRMVTDRTAWQALRSLNFYRLFVTALFCGLFFTPLMEDTIRAEALRTCRIIAGVFLLVSPMLFLLGRQVRHRPGLQAFTGLALDLWGVMVVMHAVGGVSSGVGTLLVVPMMLAGVIFPLRLSLLYAAGGTMAVLWQSLLNVLRQAEPPSVLAPAGMLGAAYFATTLLGFYLALRTRESQAIARQRSADLANLAQVNQMIVERMRTGIMIIEDNDAAHLMNESAWYLTGMPTQRTGKLRELVPDLVEDLRYWRSRGKHLNRAHQLAPGVPQVIPRFAPLATGGQGDVLVFLEDTSMVSRRAQELTLASLGRLSASIAHEIRNPLAAISHSAQLLTESAGLDRADQKLSEIIVRHCDRMNNIIENVLHLARQETARPEVIRLSDWLQSFVEEFKRHHELRGGRLELKGTDEGAEALVDPGQLQQVLWNLCQNALKYGRSPEEAANVTLDWSRGTETEPPWVEVCDEGPGIRDQDRRRMFEPFFTSSREGTGLGLYLCQQLMQANEGRISYEYEDATGSRFRVELARSRTAITPEDGASFSRSPEASGHREGSAAATGKETTR